MRVIGPFDFAKLNLSRRKFSTLIAIIAISISVCSGLILYESDLLKRLQYQMIVGEFDAVVGAKTGGTDILLGALNGEKDRAGLLPYNLYQSIRAKEHISHGDGVETHPSSIRRVIGILYFGNYLNYPAMGIEGDYFSNKALQGRSFHKNTNGVVLGAALAKKESLGLGDSIFIESDSKEVGEDFQVVGIMPKQNTSWDYLVFTSLSQSKTLLSSTSVATQSIWGNNILHYFLINMNPSAYQEMQSLIDERTVGQFIVVRDELRNLEEISGANKKLSLALMFIILLLGALTVSAVLILRFDALSGSIAILRSLGYTKWEINLWLLIEGLIIGLLATGLGFLMKVFLFPWLKILTDMKVAPFIEDQVGIFSSFPILLVAVFACILSTFIPLWNVARQDVHNLLRS